MNDNDTDLIPANALVYLFGFPGVGKSTIANALAERTKLLAIRNHLISNAFRHVLAHQKPALYTEIEPLVKHHTMKAWLNFLDFVEAATPQQGLIFTSVLYQDDPDRVEFFEFIRAWATRQNRPLLPVRLRCAPDELERRVTDSARGEDMKLTDASILRKLINTHTLLTPETPYFLDLDTTDLSAAQAADAIITALQSLNA